ncbi:MAG: hypothetical protein A2048_10065 [Deltaproteobacteria bacterium GWA2_45_12]|nr:MAG: hypothetical protein A2048_10065 [Deltaproteobacteria bacterium GWA2_45_12]
MSSLCNQFPFVDSIFKTGGEVYLVGGNVRDELLGIPHKDNDLLITGLPMESLMSLLKKEGWVNTVGKSFGIIKFRPRQKNDIEFDLSLPRVEKSVGPGHRDFEVDFDPHIPVEKDLGRRDFTINAIAKNLKTQEYLDPYNGREDLRKKILRQVFENTFVEDPLRLLRAVQFSARFHLTIEPETIAGMKKNAALIREISKERIIGEIKKLFMAEKPSHGFDLMREVGLLEFVFPFIPPMIGVMQPMKKNEDVYQHTMKVLDAARSAAELDKPGDIDLMFAALLHDAGKPATVNYDKDKDKTTFYNHQIVSKRIAKQWLNEYKATCIGVNIGKVLNMTFNHMFETKAFYSERAIRRFVNKIGKDHIFDLIDLRIADKKGGRYPDSMKGILNLRQRIQDELDKKPPFGPKDLALNGHDIMALGYKPGPIIGEIQKFLLEKVLDEPELNTKEILEKLVKEKFTV